jgi:hypothetical protein
MGFFYFYFSGTRIWTQGFTLGKQALYFLSHDSSPFWTGYFEHGVLQTVCTVWPWTMILLILATPEARITNVRHHHLGEDGILTNGIVSWKL